MIFEWDPEKNKTNFQKHGIYFDEAETVFEDIHALRIFDKEHSVDEERFIIIGFSGKERELMVCHCYKNGDEVIRIFSARRATDKEKKQYAERIGL